MSLNKLVSVSGGGRGISRESSGRGRWMPQERHEKEGIGREREMTQERQISLAIKEA